MYICDPEAEYYPLVQRLHGQVVRLSPTSKSYVNPLDINLNYSEDENPLALKSDFVLSFCELVMGGKNGLEAIEKTVIDRAVQVIYRPYLADPRPENMPILSDLHKALLDQHIPEADRVAQALDLYVNGSLNVFNHRTNVNIENRIVAFDIKELGKQLKKLGMLIVQDQIWGRVTQNAAKVRRRGTFATSSTCFCGRNRRRPFPVRFGSVSENGAASPQVPPRTSKTYFLPRRLRTFWRTATSFAY